MLARRWFLVLLAVAGLVTMSSWLVRIRAAVASPSVRPVPAATAAVVEKPSAAVSSARNNPPSSVRSPATLRIGVISDLNASYGSTHYGPTVREAVRALVDRERPDLVLITGDMVAGQRRGLDYPAMWRSFHEAVTTPLLKAGIVVAPTPGNHDAAPDRAFSAERAQYTAEWRTLERTPAVEFVDFEQYPLRYSFRYRGAFFVSIDAAGVGPLSDAQRTWLDAQLGASSERTKIVFGHLPQHPVAQNRQREILGDARVSAVFERHAVLAYFSGHHHAYYPGAVGTVRHVASPCLGGGARRLIGQPRVSESALIVVDIQDDVILSLEALRAPNFDSFIARASLPPHIVHGNHRILRDDLAGFAPPERDSAIAASASGELMPEWITQREQALRD
jgi:hypothetical protein